MVYGGKEWAARSYFQAGKNYLRVCIGKPIISASISLNQTLLFPATSAMQTQEKIQLLICSWPQNEYPQAFGVMVSTSNPDWIAYNPIIIAGDGGTGICFCFVSCYDYNKNICIIVIQTEENPWTCFRWGDLNAATIIGYVEVSKKVNPEKKNLRLGLKIAQEKQC